MALSTTILPGFFARAITVQTLMSKTPDVNVRGKATTLYSLHLQNTAASASANSVKLYDSDGDGLTVGTDAPEMIVPIAADVEMELLIEGGHVFANGLSWAAAQEDGVPATTNPAAAMPMYATTQES